MTGWSNVIGIDFDKNCNLCKKLCLNFNGIHVFLPNKLNANSASQIVATEFEQIKFANSNFICS